MNHEHARAALPDLACGLVTGNERAEVDDHLRACQVCSAELRVYTEAAAALGMAAAVVPQALAMDGELPVLDGPGLARIVAAARSRFAAAEGEAGVPVAAAAIESAVAAVPAEARTRHRRFRRERPRPRGDEPTSQPALLAPIIADIPEEPAEDDAAWRRGHVIELPEEDTAAGNGMPVASPESAEAQEGAQAEEPPDDPDAVLDRIDSLFVAGSLSASANLLSDLAPPLHDGEAGADDGDIPAEAAADGPADRPIDGTRGRGWLRQQRLRGGADDSPQPEPGAADSQGAFTDDLFEGLDGDSEPPPDTDSLLALDPEPTTDWTAADLFGDLLTPGAAAPIEDFDEPPFALAFQDPGDDEGAAEPVLEESALTEEEPRGSGWLRRKVRRGPTEVARAAPIEDDASDSFDDFDPLPAAAPMPVAASEERVAARVGPATPERMPSRRASIDDLGLGGYESSDESEEEDEDGEGKVGAGWRFWAVLFGLTTVVLAGGLIAGFLVLLDVRETSREFEGQLAVSALQVGLAGDGVQGIAYISADSRRALLVIDGLKQVERGQQLVVWTEETNGTVTRARAFSPNRETRQYLEITRIPRQLKRIFITLEPTPAASTPAPTSTGGTPAASPTPRPVLKPTGSVVATGELPAFAR